jgi:DNA-binding transcriptional regulator YhcF (GntR family)
MRNGWIKLHLSTLDNEVWLRDPTAWRVFEYLCLHAYTGKPQGTVVTSRHKIAEGTLGNNNTVYKALKRLEKYKMITSSVTNKYTTVRICKWHNYQTDGNKSGNNKVTTKEQQSNTLIRIKNKEYKPTATTLIINSPEISEALTEFIAHRKALKKPLTQKALTLIENKLHKKYPNNPTAQIEDINRSIEHGWQTVAYEDANTSPKQTKESEFARLVREKKASQGATQ